jgi:hypothetical protein
MKDWTGNRKTTFAVLGASSHSDHERAAYDYYATEPRCAVELAQVEKLFNIWEPACGEGHLAKEFDKQAVLGRATDLIDRGFGQGAVDFLMTSDRWDGWIITNPPYKFAQEFCEHALTLSDRVAMFLKLTFLEGQKRHKFFLKNPPNRIYVYSQRRKCALNGKFEETGSSAAAYAWFVWDKSCPDQQKILWI